MDTPGGRAEVLVDLVDRPLGVAVLGHGAGGGVSAPDLLALRAALLSAGITVARVLQPYRVAGRRAPAPAARLDEAWECSVSAVLAAVGEAGGTAHLPHVVGGRSSGARVACRTAAATGATGVLALAFPLVPPGRSHRTRLPELLGAGAPVLVVQGSRDVFGSAAEVRAALRAAGAAHVDVQEVLGADHALRRPRGNGAGSTAGLDEAVARAVAWVVARTSRS